MTGTPSPDPISTRRQRIAELARQSPQAAFTTLAHHIDIDWLTEAYRRTRKDGAAGVDGQTGEDYAADLEANLRSLLDRAKSGRYQAPPVRRVHIPRGPGRRPGPSASRRLRIKSSSGRSPWSWRPFTSRTFWTARTGSGRAARGTRRWRRSDGG